MWPKPPVYQTPGDYKNPIVLNHKIQIKYKMYHKMTVFILFQGNTCYKYRVLIVNIHGTGLNLISAVTVPLSGVVLKCGKYTSVVIQDSWSGFFIHVKTDFCQNELGTGPSSSSQSIRSAVNYRDGSISKSIFLSESFFMSWVFRNIEALVKIPPFVSAKIFDLSLKLVFKLTTKSCFLIGQWAMSFHWLK